MTENKQTRPKRSFGGLRQRSSGRWAANYTGPDGGTHRAPRTFEREDSAIAWLDAERRLIELDAWTPPSARGNKKKSGGLTVRAFSEKWWDATATRHKPATRQLNRIYLDVTILPTLADIPLATLTVDDIRQWWAGLEAFPTRNANAYSLLRTILGQAVEDELIPVNPCRVKGAAVKHRKVEPVALSATEIRALAAAMPARWSALVLLAGFSGLRWGELAALHRSDLKLDPLEVTVNRAVTRAGGEFVIARPKSRAALRTVPLPDPLREPLKAHIAQWSSPGRAGLIFPAQSGDTLNRDTVKEPFKTAASAIGYDSLRFHDLRHSAATLFAQAGTTLADHMTLMGHTSSAMSARYTHSTATRTRSLVQGIWTD